MIGIVRIVEDAIPPAFVNTFQVVKRKVHSLTSNVMMSRMPPQPVSLYTGDLQISSPI